MDTALRDKFLKRWPAFFPDTDLPITFEITDIPRDIPRAPAPGGWRCIICDLHKVRSGASLFLDEASVTCSGGRIFTGFEKTRSPEFRYFLSCGKGGVVRGERYKKTPEIIDESVKRMASLPSQGKGLLFRAGMPLAQRTPRMSRSSLPGPKYSAACSRSQISIVQTRTGSPVPLGRGAVPSSITRGSNSRRNPPGLSSACSTRQRESALHRISSPLRSR